MLVCKQLSNLDRSGDLSRKLVETIKLNTYLMMYLLLKLVLVLHVATATFERSFSIVHFMKDQLHDHMRGEFLNDCWATYIE